MAANNVPPIDPILIPDCNGGKRKRRKKGIRLLPTEAAEPTPIRAEKVEAKSELPAAEEKKQPPPSLEDLLQFMDGCDTTSGRELERALLAQAYLLEWASNLGNTEVPGYLAYGIVQALRKCARDARPLMTRRDLSNLSEEKADALDEED